MGTRARQQLVREVPTVLAGLLDVPRAEVQLDKGGALEADLVVRAGGHAFVVDVLDAAAPGLVAAHAEVVVTAVRKLRRKATPLPAVPYMTEPRRVRRRGGGRTPSTILLAAARDVSGGAAGSDASESKPYERVSSTVTVRSQEEYARLLVERNHRRQRWENQPAVDVRVEQLAREELLHLEAVRAGRAVRAWPWLGLEPEARCGIRERGGRGGETA